MLELVTIDSCFENYSCRLEL